MRLACRNCRGVLEIPPEEIREGRKVRCCHCGRSFLLEGLDELLTADGRHTWAQCNRCRGRYAVALTRLNDGCRRCGAADALIDLLDRRTSKETEPELPVVSALEMLPGASAQTAEDGVQPHAPAPAARQFKLPILIALLLTFGVAMAWLHRMRQQPASEQAAISPAQDESSAAAASANPPQEERRPERVLPKSINVKDIPFSVRVDQLAEDTHVSPGGKTVPYRYFVPRQEDVPPGERVPLVLFLHGLGEHGTDNRRQLSRHVGCMIFVQPEVQRHYPCYFVAPQITSGLRWSSGNLTRPSSSLQAAIDIVDEFIRQNDNLDPKRLYVTGLSSGGAGAWDALAKFPGKFAGAAPMCAGWDPKMLRERQDVRVWTFYASRENAFTRTHCEAMLARVGELGGTTRKTVYEQHGHNVWSRAYREPELVPWLFRFPGAVDASSDPPR